MTARIQTLVFYLSGTVCAARQSADAAREFAGVPGVIGMQAQLR